MAERSDSELKDLLATWQAPAAPASLERRVFGKAQGGWSGWYRWLWTGSIRVPAPIAVGLLLLLVWMALAPGRGLHRAPSSQGTIADFEPVKELRPRVIRVNYENR